MKNRTRPFRVVRWIPYALVVLIAVWALILQLQTFRPFEGSIPFLYEKIIYVLVLVLLICSAITKGVLRNVVVLISCSSLFSLSLMEFVKLQGQVARYATPGGDEGAIYIPWRLVAFLGLLFLVMIIEAVMLIRSRADRP